MKHRSTAFALWGLGVAMVGCGAPPQAPPIAPSLAPQPSHASAVAADAPPPSGESYQRLTDNRFQSADRAQLSTFGVDVDTASYSNVRRFLLDERRLPPADAVRVEEMINYFHYDYPAPTGQHPFSVTTDVAACPWEPSHRLVRIALQGRTIAAEQVPPRNLVFLLDVSGSMNEPNKLPLVKAAMKLLVEQLRAVDTLSIAVYAGSEGLALAPTSGDRKTDILSALDRLGAGGSTNGGAGIKLAYRTARQSFKQGGINRVILASDGDFNVGITSMSDLEKLIEDERKSGVFLTVLGVGTGNLKDATMERLADRGNGNYAYLDSIAEAKKVLVTQAGGTLITIAKDVKIQVDMNPRAVASYRLIGYENRLLAAEDFKDDRKDAGDIGAGHSVTALYEILPIEPGEDAAKAPPGKAAGGPRSDLLTVRLRYKQPDQDQSLELVSPLAPPKSIAPPAGELEFAAAVAGFGMLLRDSPHKGSASYAMVRAMAERARGQDKEGYRAELLRLMTAAEGLSPRAAK